MQPLNSVGFRVEDHARRNGHDEDQTDRQDESGQRPGSEGPELRADRRDWLPSALITEFSEHLEQFQALLP